MADYKNVLLEVGLERKSINLTQEKMKGKISWCGISNVLILGKQEVELESKGVEKLKDKLPVSLVEWLNKA